MMRHSAACLCCLLLAAPAAAAELPCWGALTGDHVRVRSGADVAFRAMCTLEKGHVIRLLEVSDDGTWYRIVPPEEGDVYISADFVRNIKGTGTVTGDRVNVRVRPSLTGEVVTQLDKGAGVKIKGIEQTEKRTWYKVVPPTGSAAWISAEYVERMTDAELAAFRKKKAEEAREAAERKRRERDEARLARVVDWVAKHPEAYDRGLAKCAEAIEQARHPAVLARLKEVRAGVARRQQLAERRRAEERKRREEERKRREAERKKRERAIVAVADATFARELQKPLPERALGAVLDAYKRAQKKVTERPLKEKIAAQLVVIGDMRSMQSAIAEKKEPPPLSEFDFDAAAGRFDMKREVEALQAARRLAARIAKTVREEPEKKPSPTTAEGWIFYLGPGLGETGATHRVTRNGKVVALVKSRQLDFSVFVGSYLKVTGTPAGTATVRGRQVPVIDATLVQEVLD
ncbi:MAG: SH3 domain-containing protein [Planctomycetota bacterium]